MAKIFPKQSREKYTIPRSVQDVIPIDCIWKEGVFQSGEYYSKQFRFDDINYAVASREDKETMFLCHSALLNSLDSGAITKISIVNHQFDKKQFQETILKPMRGDENDRLRKEYNDLLTEKATDSNGIVQDKYITISVPKRNIDSARAYLNRMGATLEEQLSNLNSRCRTLDATDRLKVLHDFLRQGEEPAFFFDFDNAVRNGISFKDYIVPDDMSFKKDHFTMGEKYGRVLNLHIDASFLRDSFINELCDMNRDMILTIDINPVPTDEAVKIVEKKLLGAETNIANWQRRQNASQNFAAVIPYDMELQRKETVEFMDDLTTRDQAMMLASVVIVHTAESKEQLDNDTETLQTVARKNLCRLSVLKYQQSDGLKTALPFGVSRLDNCWRTLTTESTAVLMPFRVQEILHANGHCVGQNAISHNPILVNRAELMNPAGFYLGVPGSGKSMGAKAEMEYYYLFTDDDILCCDPMGEYSVMAKAFKYDAEVINLSAGSPHHINAMDMEVGYGDSKNSVIDKSQFILSLFEQLVGSENLGAREKSIIDRCVKIVYKKFAKKKTPPCLPDLRDEILKQPEEEAKGLALACELFTNGSLDTFAHQTNVEINSRLVVYDIHDLGSQLKTLGLLVVTDAMLNRVTRNFREGRRTHLYFDEFHVVFENEYSSNFFNNAWRMFRKRNAFVSGITQNVEYLLDSVTARTMLSNSEYIVMYNQAASDRVELARLLNISSQQLSYITNASAGNGLIRVGSALVPFINQIKKTTEMYRIMTTKPSEVIM